MTPSMKRRFAALAAVLLAGIAMAEPRPAVLELYTSEGCSSCPPAEEFIAELAQRRPDVLPLSFHVDYWNDLGWHDRFTFSDATRRQRAYAAGLRLDSVYTPQAVIDGGADYVGSARQSVLSALAAPREGVATRITRGEGHIDVSISEQHGGRAADVLLIGYLRQATSHIGRGENAGRTLQEFNIVRSLQRLGSWRGEAGAFKIPLDSVPPDATHVAVLVQAVGQGAILGAASLQIR